MTSALYRFLIAGGCIGLWFLPGVIGSRFEPGMWYQALNKPKLTPPGWVFPIAWSMLYLMMGIALWLILESQPLRKLGVPLTAFGAQLLLNGLWSWLFFGAHKPGLALVDISLLGILILLCAVLFWHIKPIAGLLLAPYLLWVLFTSWLNYGLWRLN